MSLRVLVRSFRFADGVDPKRFLRQISSKDLFCVAGKFFCKFLGRGHSLPGTFLGETIRFSLRTAESAIFKLGH